MDKEANETGISEETQQKQSSVSSKTKGLDFSGLARLRNGNYALIVTQEGKIGYYGYRIIGRRLLFDTGGNSAVDSKEDIVACLRERSDVPIEIVP